MSNQSKLRYLVVLLFAVFAITALVSADFSALAQNANSSTTGDDSAQNANMTAMPRRGGRRRRHRARRAAAAAAADAASMAATSAQTGDVSGDQTDLSGTYTGHVMMSGGMDMDGDGTLTITGNTFALESGGTTHNGRVYAVTTRGYTGASFYFPDSMNSTTNTPVVANVRAKKNGDRLWLMPVPGASTKMMFSSGGGMGGGHHRARRRHRAHRRAMTPAATTGDNSNTSPPL